MSESQPDAIATPVPMVSLTDAVVHFESLGPWRTAESAAMHLRLGIPELQAMIERNELIGVHFADEKLYFPDWQFDDGGVVDGLAEVLLILSPALTAPETCAAWLAATVYEDSSLRYIDLLREGHVREVVDEANRTASRILD